MKKTMLGKMLKRLGATAMAMTLVVGTMTAAYATYPGDGTYGTPGSYTEGGDHNANPVNAIAAITKNLTMAAGVHLQNEATFTFTFAPSDPIVDAANSHNGDTGVAVAEVPDIADVSVTYPANTADDAGKTFARKSVNIVFPACVPGGDPATQYTKAGTYYYLITETQTGYTDDTDATDGTTDAMTYDPQTYMMIVRVSNTVDATGAEALYIDTILVQKTTVETTEAGDVVTPGDKVDPTPPDDVVDKNTFTFTNVYTRENYTTPTNKDSALSIQKLVTGTAGDKTIYFPFTTTLNNPAADTYDADTTTLDTTVYAHIEDADGNVITSANLTNNAVSGTVSDDTAVAPDYDGRITVTVGTPLTYSLKHGQKLVFDAVLVGSTYTGSETDAKTHTASNVSTNYGVLGASVSGTTFTFPTDITTLTISDVVVTPGAGIDDPDIVTAAVNKVVMTNNKEGTPLTGILVDNLPFIALLAVIAGAFGVYVISKRRRNGTQ